MKFSGLPKQAQETEFEHRLSSFKTFFLRSTLVTGILKNVPLFQNDISVRPYD